MAQNSYAATDASETLLLISGGFVTFHRKSDMTSMTNEYHFKPGG